MNNQTDKLIPELRFPEFMKNREWNEKTLDDVCDITNGKANVQDHVENGKYPLFDRSEVIKSTNNFIFDCEAVIIPGEGMRFIPKYYVGKFNLHQRAYALKDFTCDGKFVYYSMLFNSNLISRKAVQSTVLSLRLPILQTFPIDVPEESSEQQKIASCLSSVDEVLTAHINKLENLKTYKKGLMQNFFPQEGENVPKLRFKEFENGEDWVEKSIQSLIDDKFIISHLDGNHGALYPQADEFSKEGVPYITANDFIGGVVEFTKCKYLPNERAIQFKKGVAKDGDILFAHNATVGPVAKLSTELPFVILSTTATYFRCNNKYLLNDFLKFALTSPRFVNQYTRVMSQSTRNQVPITTQRKFILQLPLIEEQQKIADSLSSLDELIREQTNKIEQLKLHKKGLMQGLFPKVKI